MQRLGPQECEVPGRERFVGHDGAHSIAALRAVYDMAWEAKLNEIRERDRKAAFIPYEAHDAGLAAVREQALTDARDAVAALGYAMDPDTLAFPNGAGIDRLDALAAIDNLKGAEQ